MKNLKRIIGGTFLVLMASFHVSTAQNPEVRNLQDFNSLALSGAYEVILQNSNETKVEVTGTSEVPNDEIVTEIKNGTLKVYFKNENNKRNMNKSPKLVVYYRQIKSIDNTGAINLRNEGVLKTNSLAIDLAGAGNINLNIATEDLKVDMAGAGNLTLQGSATSQDYDLSGAGNISAYDLVGDNVTIDLSGVSNAKIYAKKTLDASISGMGRIKYKGNPSKVKVSESMMGSVSAE